MKKWTCGRRVEVGAPDVSNRKSILIPRGGQVALNSLLSSIHPDHNVPYNLTPLLDSHIFLYSSLAQTTCILTLVVLLVRPFPVFVKHNYYGNAPYNRHGHSRCGNNFDVQSSTRGVSIIRTNQGLPTYYATTHSMSGERRPESAPPKASMTRITQTEEMKEKTEIAPESGWTYESN